jgi:hypothetical protein
MTNVPLLPAGNETSQTTDIQRATWAKAVFIENSMNIPDLVLGNPHLQKHKLIDDEQGQNLKELINQFDENSLIAVACIAGFSRSLEVMWRLMTIKESAQLPFHLSRAGKGTWGVVNGQSIPISGYMASTAMADLIIEHGREITKLFNTILLVHCSSMQNMEITSLIRAILYDIASNPHKYPYINSQEEIEFIARGDLSVFGLKLFLIDKAHDRIY